MTTPQATNSLPTSSKEACAAYALIAIGALIATWTQNAAYFGDGGRFLIDFLNDSRTTAASRSLTADFMLFALAVIILMVLEARKHGVRFVWAYIVGGFLIAISVTFPLFLIARERRVGRTDTPRLSAIDTALLVVVACATVAQTIWVEMG
jgi:hypothetical protein